MVGTEKPKRNLVFTVVFFILAFLGGFLTIFLSNDLFPDNGGFNRTIIFVRPQPDTEDPGYFIVIDEFEPKDTFEAVFHSYGNLTCSESGKTAIFNQSGTEMKLQFIGPDIRIRNYVNGVYWTYPWKSDPDWVEYIKVEPRDANCRRLITLITFKNSSVDYPTVDLDGGSEQIHLTVNSSDHFVFPISTVEGGAISTSNMSSRVSLVVTG